MLTGAFLPAMGQGRHHVGYRPTKCLVEFRPPILVGDSPSVSAKLMRAPTFGLYCFIAGLRPNEDFQHGPTHEVRRQQTLSKDEIMELLLVKFRAERYLNLAS